MKNFFLSKLRNSWKSVSLRNDKMMSHEWCIKLNIIIQRKYQRWDRFVFFSNRIEKNRKIFKSNRTESNRIEKKKKLCEYIEVLDFIKKDYLQQPFIHLRWMKNSLFAIIRFSFRTEDYDRLLGKFTSPFKMWCSNVIF